MSKAIQVRNVPDEIHRMLEVRSARLGLSLSDYLLLEIKRIAKGPTRDELLERIARRAPVSARPCAADAVRAERERR
jgi:plasmid stability protein